MRAPRTPTSLLAGVLLVAALAVVPAAASATATTTSKAPSVPAASAASTVSNASTVADSSDSNSDRTGNKRNHDDCVAVAADTRENPPSDRLGWEDGCWYDDAIDVTRSDGLNDTELAAVVARAMARVEFVRELEFRNRTPVEVISRSEFEDRTAERFDDASAKNRLHQNVKYEALFMIGESADALAVQQGNVASGTLGYYTSATDEIVIVSENTTSPKMNEITLAQELFHSLQYHRFDASDWNWSTRERHNANDGIIEGDGNFVDHRYQQRCEDNWSCLEPLTRPSAGDRHVGVLALQLQPYSDGPVFVQEIYREEGWEGVNAVYENPPRSTEQVIHSDRYRSDPPTNVTVTHTASDGWHVLDLKNGVDYAEFGEAGMYAMLWYPAYETRNAPETHEVIPLSDWLVQGDELDLYNYDHPFTAGWDGDKLYPYVNDTSNRTGETGYVWKSVWDGEAEAEEFVRGYRTLLREFGADPVPGRANTYRIGEGEFADAFYFERSGETVVIVNAPTVAALRDVRAGAAPEATPTPTATSTPSPTFTVPETTGACACPTPRTTLQGSARANPNEETPETAPPTGADGTTTNASGPGPGALAALVVVVAGATALARRRRRRP